MPVQLDAAALLLLSLAGLSAYLCSVPCPPPPPPLSRSQFGILCKWPLKQQQLRLPPARGNRPYQLPPFPCHTAAVLILTNPLPGYCSK